MLDIRRRLRDASAEAHARVDQAYARFDLSRRHDYAEFLAAHARVLPRAEAALAALPVDWSPRAPLLHSDLVELGHSPASPPTAKPPPDQGRAWGMLYVLEGSRFGGAALAKRVGAGLPRRYLSASHSVEGWRAFESALERAGQAGGAGWLRSAIAGALGIFEDFESAAALELGVRGEC